MKNVFNMDMTNNPDNERIDGAQFITQTLDPVLLQQVDRIADQAQEQEDKAELPLVLRILRGLAGICALICVGGLVKALGKVTFLEGFHNAPGVYIIGGIALIVWAVLAVWSRARARKVSSSPEQAALERDAEQIAQAALTDLGVPEDAKKIDVLYRVYHVKNGKEKSDLDYINDEKWVYRSPDALCIADVRTVVSIPISSVISTEVRKKRVRMMQWNKEQAPNSAEYKPYRVTKNDGVYYIRSCTALRIHDVFGDYEILILNYDADTVCGMLNLSVDV